MVINSCYGKTKSQVNSNMEFDINESESTAKVKFNFYNTIKFINI